MLFRIVDTGHLADGMCDVTGCGCKGAASLIHSCSPGVDAFGEDASVPVACEERFECFVAAGGEEEFVGDAPRTGEGQSVASRKAIGLVGVGVLVVFGMQPLPGTHKGWIEFGDEAEDRELEQGSRWDLGE